MPIEDLPPEVRLFLASAVPSVPYLEAALLVRREPETDWTAQRLATRLYVRQRQAQALLDELVEAGLVVARGGDGSADADRDGFRFTEDPTSCALIDRVAEVYALNLAEVASFIHARTDDSARRFAAAFKLRKD